MPDIAVARPCCSAGALSPINTVTAGIITAAPTPNTVIATTITATELVSPSSTKATVHSPTAVRSITG